MYMLLENFVGRYITIKKNPKPGLSVTLIFFYYYLSVTDIMLKIFNTKLNTVQKKLRQVHVQTSRAV